jgi:hypothetical protein
MRVLVRILNAAALEDVTISTEEHSVTAVARTVLLRAGWL